MALNKNPGVRPISICKTVRRIISKAILSVTKGDIQDAVGTTQLCAGRIAGIEAGIHSVRDLFNKKETEGVLLVDASNAFNSLNRQTALQNARRLCPSLATMLINTYREPTDLFVDGDVLSSREGTTQGDPLAMPMYAIATAPLIQKLNADVTQIWYTDDASGVGRLPCLRRWWDQINSLGPGFGYFANAVKTWLITKEEHLAEAKETFAGTNVQITTDGKPHLGAPIGSLDFRKQFVDQKVQEWCNEVRVLSSIAHSKPQAAYAAFTHGMISKWTFLLRTVPDIQQNLQPLENTIRSTFILAVTGRSPPNDSECTLFALPTRLGGLGLADPSIQSYL